jgi:hypothetical protein
MPRPIKSTRTKRGKWARYNARRAADREADRLKRQARREERQREAEARLLAELAEQPIQPPAGPRAKPLRIRLTVEVLAPDGERTRHAFTSAWCPLFRAWSVPASRIREGIAGLMRHAPEIATPPNKRPTPRRSVGMV